MSAKRSDAEMVQRLLERLKLVVAVSEEIPTEAKLQLQPLIGELAGGLALDQADQDKPRMRAYLEALLRESNEDADVSALVTAVRNFLPAD